MSDVLFIRYVIYYLYILYIYIITLVLTFYSKFKIVLMFYLYENLKVFIVQTYISS